MISSILQNRCNSRKYVLFVLPLNAYYAPCLPPIWRRLLLVMVPATSAENLLSCSGLNPKSCPHLFIHALASCSLARIADAQLQAFSLCVWRTPQHTSSLCSMNAAF